MSTKQVNCSVKPKDLYADTYLLQVYASPQNSPPPPLYIKPNRHENRARENRKIEREKEREMEGKCKHSSQKESRGVCPYCLKEKLEQLTASSVNSSTTILSSSMASSAASSSYNASSFNASPRNRHHSKKTLLYLFKGGKEEPLRRSSSLAFPIGEGKERKEKEKEKEKKKMIKRRSVRSGSMFWGKFVSAGEGRRKERKLEGLYHSKTAKEKPSSRWAFFV